MHLYTYWRSSSAYRVRIALNLKGLDLCIDGLCQFVLNAIILLP